MIQAYFHLGFSNIFKRWIFKVWRSHNLGEQKNQWFIGYITLKTISEHIVLACDIWDKIPGNDESYSVTTTNLIGPCARSVFVLKR